MLSVIGIHVASLPLGAISPAGEAEPVRYYDMTPLLSLDLAEPAARRRLFDETHLVTSLQGLVNRDAPRLYLRYNAPPDDFWWQVMTEPGGWLEGRAVERVGSIEELLGRYGAFFRGAVVWDERVPATSNLASTIAGCEGLVCLRYDDDPGSLYQRLQLPEVVRLMAPDGSPLFTGQGTIPGTDVPSTGSAKCDAYLWLVEHYLKTGKVAPTPMGYYLDGYWLNCWHAGAPQNHTLTNHDYVIANKGVVFDLGVWDDETVVDDPGQAPGTDAATLCRLLRAAYDAQGGEGTIHVAGFVPWAYKYTNWHSDAWNAGGKHDGVPTEWRYAEILSCYNAYMDADALGMSAMANASFFQHYPVPDRVPQNPKPTRESLAARGILDGEGKIAPRFYYAHYVGDYDSAAWLYWMLPSIYTDPRRGDLPLSWAFNPNLCERFPLGMAWARERRTANDFFVAGDSGAGYLNPGYLTEPRPYSGLPSGVAVWERHCERLYRQWDLSLTGFVIDGYSRPMDTECLDAYARFSPDGVVAQKIPPQGLHGDMPFIRMGGDLPHGTKEAADVILTRFRGYGPKFAVYRSILKPPSWYVGVRDEVRREAGEQVVCVDLNTLLWLVREYEQHREQYASTPSPFAAATRISLAPDSEDGLAAVAAEDGPVDLTTEEGVACFRIVGHRPMQYLYLDADDGFLPGGPEPLTIELVFRLPSGTAAAPAVEYDSSDARAPGGGAYKRAEVVRVEDAGAGWNRATYQAPDAAFSGGQNSQADLRIVGTDEDLRVRSVAVRRRE